jgi:hypothetical protein
MLYPTWKLSERWSMSGAVQIHSRPYFFEQLSTQGYGIEADVLQANLSYSRFWRDKSVAVRVGQLSSVFGSFLLRYDDAANPLIDMPSAYGYYYKSVATCGLAGAQVDATFKKLDVRAQFVNSSPANRRSLLDKDQYGNWAGGLGFTILQGLRAGASAYYGPYLHRQHRYYRPGEANPRDLPASGVGLDLQAARGHWNANGELQWFRKTYRAMPTRLQQGGYGEIRRTLHPQWYVASRIGYMRSGTTTENVYEAAVGFRPKAHQLIKVGYQIAPPKLGNTLAVQFVTTLPLL